MYDSLIIINFRKHLIAKHSIVIEKRQNLTFAKISNEFDRFYKKLYKNDQIKKIEIKILKKVLYQKMINDVLILTIVIQNFLFSFVKWLKFYIFYRTFNLQMTSYLMTIYIIIFIIIDNSW